MSWLGLPVLVTRESIDTTTKQLSRLPLIKIEFPPHPRDVIGINEGGVYLTLKQANQLTVAVAMFTIQDDFATRRTKVTDYRWNQAFFTLVGVGQIAGVMNLLCRTACGTFHRHNSLKETISTSSITVSFR